MVGATRGKLKLSGVDRRGPPPPATRRGAPLRPLTVPNLVGYVRLALIAVFAVLAAGSDDGRSTAAFLVYGLAAAGDYLDGLLARITGQYSRLGALLDPFTDRILVIAGVIVCWHFSLLPEWALAVMVVREAVMLLAVGAGLWLGLDIEINMVGRLSVWFVMAGIGLALVSGAWIPRAFFYVGLTGSILASLLYFRDGAQHLRGGGKLRRERHSFPKTGRRLE